MKKIGNTLEWQKTDERIQKLARKDRVTIKKGTVFVKMDKIDHWKLVILEKVTSQLINKIQILEHQG